MGGARSRAFFRDVDWSKMERKEVAPPHTPVLKPYLVETPAASSASSPESCSD